MMSIRFAVRRASPLPAVAIALGAALCAGASGCAEDGAAKTEPDDVAEPGACAAGELALDDGRCQPAGLPLDMPCPPGEQEIDGRCAPAGVPPEACAAGFTPRDGGCDPVLPARDCAPGLMAVPGETACREVAPCGDGTYGDIPVEPDTEFVDQAYPAEDGDGSAERPWRTIQQGVDAAASGAIVAVAAGRYEEAVTVAERPVRLWGRCPRLVELAQAGDAYAALTVSRAPAATTHVRGVAVTGPQIGVFVRGATSVEIDEVWIHDVGSAGLVVNARGAATVRGALVERSTLAGISVEESAATIESSVVRDTEPGARNTLGLGVQVLPVRATKERGALTIRSSLIERNTYAGVLIDGSDATIESSVIRSTRQGIPEKGQGITLKLGKIADGATLLMRSSVVERNQDSGVMALGGEVTIESSVLRDNQGDDRGSHGFGLDAQSYELGGRPSLAVVRSSLIEGNYGLGVSLNSSEGRIDGTIVRRTVPAESGEGGFGVQVYSDLSTGGRSSLSLSSSIVEQNRDVGVAVHASDATIERSIVRDTLPDAGGASGRAIEVQSGDLPGQRGSLTLRSSLLERNRQVGVVVAGSDATVSSSVVRDTAAADSGLAGFGFEIVADPESGERSDVTATAVLIEKSHTVGVLVERSTLTVEAVVVRDTESDASGAAGGGIVVQSNPALRDGARLVASAALIEENRAAGILVNGAEATIERSIVRNTALQGSDNQLGDGIVVIDTLGQSTATIFDTRSTGNARAGLMFVGSGGLFSHVRSSDNRFGIVLQGDLRPVAGEGVDLVGNSESDRIVEGDFEVPDAIVPLP